MKYAPSIITQARQMLARNVRLGEVAERLDVPAGALDRALWKAIDHNGVVENRQNENLKLMSGGEAA